MTEILKKNKIKDTLLRIGAINEDNIATFSLKTRDRNGLSVYKDQLSKVIFIDDYYVGDIEYHSGAYRNESLSSFDFAARDLEKSNDAERRFSKYRQFIAGKSIVDFGCGEGSFLYLSRNLANNVFGVELQQNYKNSLMQQGIYCFSSIDEIKGDIDTVFLFHCLEHLPDPTETLLSIKQKLQSHTKSSTGRIVIEVPHARDFLIDTLSLSAFIDFTLWSQHLILHTRDSLYRMLADAGFKNIVIEGIQRYGLSNHMNWLHKGKPGGHKESFSIFETTDLNSAYSSALCKIDATDTLVAVAEI